MSALCWLIASGLRLTSSVSYLGWYPVSHSQSSSRQDALKSSSMPGDCTVGLAASVVAQLLLLPGCHWPNLLFLYRDGQKICQTLLVCHLIWYISKLLLQKQVRFLGNCIHFISSTLNNADPLLYFATAQNLVEPRVTEMRNNLKNMGGKPQVILATESANPHSKHFAIPPPALLIKIVFLHMLLSSALQLLIFWTQSTFFQVMYPHSFLKILHM